MHKYKLRILFYLGLAIVALYTYFCVVPVLVFGDSMSPNIGDNSIYLCKSYNTGDTINRFDVIAFKKECESSCVKRVIGLPGEHLQIINNVLYVNDNTIDTQYFSSDLESNDVDINVPENEYFVLGDNLEHSIDSRDPKIGLVSSDEIIGKGFRK